MTTFDPAEDLQGETLELLVGIEGLVVVVSLEVDPPQAVDDLGEPDLVVLVVREQIDEVSLDRPALIEIVQSLAQFLLGGKAIPDLRATIGDVGLESRIIGPLRGGFSVDLKLRD